MIYESILSFLGASDFRCLKDLVEILYHLLEGFEAHQIQKQDWHNRKRGYKQESKPKHKKKQTWKMEALDQRIDMAKDKTKSLEKEIADVAREEKRGIGKEAH